MGRERALVGLVCALVGLAVARAEAPRPSGVALACAPGELHRLDGVARCGPGEPLSGGERRALGLPLELNRATAEELEALPGIGAGLAKRIVEDREARGGFPSVESLARVSGVGPGKLRLLAGRVTVQAAR